jgi:hypothetical protein
MLAVLALRKLRGVFGVNLRSGRLRLHVQDPQGLLKAWHQHWPFSELKWLGYSLVEPDMGDVFTAYSQDYNVEHRGQVNAAGAK